MALLSGHRDLSQIHRFGQRLTQKQHKELGLPRKKNTEFRRVPGYKVYYNLLAKLDPDMFAQRIVREMPDLNGKLVTGDALNTQQETAQQIVLQGGDYLLQVKNNQKTVRQLAEAGMEGLSPLLSRSEKNTDERINVKS